MSKEKIQNSLTVNFKNIEFKSFFLDFVLCTNKKSNSLELIQIVFLANSERKASIPANTKTSFSFNKATKPSSKIGKLRKVNFAKIPRTNFSISIFFVSSLKIALYISGKHYFFQKSNLHCLTSSEWRIFFQDPEQPWHFASRIFNPQNPITVFRNTNIPNSKFFLQNMKYFCISFCVFKLNYETKLLDFFFPMIYLNTPISVYQTNPKPTIISLFRYCSSDSS